MKYWVKLLNKRRAADAWLLLTLWIVLLLLVLLLPLRALGLTADEERLEAAYMQGEVIRLHILAENDTPQAQAVKLAVRDAILATYGRQLAAAGIRDADSAYAWLLENREGMLQVAAEKAKACGFSGAVTAEVGCLLLPEKQYGEVVLPAGEYRALRITLGKGEGQNWWCVLFPRLCLSLAGEAQQPASVEQARLQWHSLHILSRWFLFGAEAVHDGSR